MQEYDLATFCKWIGNSPAVSAKHYAVSVDWDGDFRRAAGIPETGAVKIAIVSGAQQVSANGQDIGNNEKAPENRGSDELCHTGTNANNTGQWALQGSNL